MEPYCCHEMGWMVEGKHCPAPDPDHRGSQIPPDHPKPCQVGLQTPASHVWGKLGLVETAAPSSIQDHLHPIKW